MPDIGVPELLIVAVIVLLLFGPSKAADVGGALGKSIRAFRQASREDDPAPPLMARSPEPAGACPACNTQTQADQKFCTGCGGPV